MYHWLFQAQDERKFRKYYNTDMLVWKLKGFLGEIWNWLCTQRIRRDWGKGGASLGWREAGLRTKELHARPVLGGLKMSRSPHAPTRIFEAFIDALMWVISPWTIQMVSIALCFLKSGPWKCSHWGNYGWKIHSKDGEDMQSLWLLQTNHANQWSLNDLLQKASWRWPSPRENKWLAPRYRQKRTESVLEL